MGAPSDFGGIDAGGEGAVGGGVRLDRFKVRVR